MADTLGMTGAIASRPKVIEGHYTAQLEGPFVYGAGKVEAIAKLAADRGYDLAASYAYSDSISDLPMLELVGHPVAVNPDGELEDVAHDRGWPVVVFAAQDQTGDRPGSELDRGSFGSGRLLPARQTARQDRRTGEEAVEARWARGSISSLRSRFEVRGLKFEVRNSSFSTQVQASNLNASNLQAPNPSTRFHRTALCPNSSRSSAYSADRGSTLWLSASFNTLCLSSETMWRNTGAEPG